MNLIETAEHEAELDALARSWKGTPWVPDGAVKGYGVSCTMLPQVVLNEFCAAHGLAPLPAQRTRRGLPKAQILPLMISTFEAQAEHWQRVEHIRCGDVLVFEFGIGHAALALNSAEILHCLGNGGTEVIAWKSDRICERFHSAWRPLKPLTNGQHT